MGAQWSPTLVTFDLKEEVLHNRCMAPQRIYRPPTDALHEGCLLLPHWLCQEKRGRGIMLLSEGWGWIIGGAKMQLATLSSKVWSVPTLVLPENLRMKWCWLHVEKYQFSLCCSLLGDGGDYWKITLLSYHCGNGNITLVITLKLPFKAHPPPNSLYEGQHSKKDFEH